MPRLIVIRGADEGKQFDLGHDRLGIGRDGANRVRLHDTEVSRRHAELVRTADGGFRVLDVGSANGTFVNGKPVRDVLLQPGDQVQVGQTLLLYTAVRSDPAPTSLADRINVITRQDMDLPSAIVKRVTDTEGSRLLERPDRVESAWLRANLGVLYEAIQAVSQIHDVGQLLDRLMELVFRTIPADRGCMLVRPDDPDLVARPGQEAVLAADALRPQAIRWRKPAAGTDETFPVSRTILDYVVRERAGILVSDAARDARFQTVQSLVKSGVREVMCVPMRGRHDTLGVLYLDSLTAARDLMAAGQPGKFTEDHLSLAIALAHQAALAIEDTRFYQAMLQAERLAAVGQTIAAVSHHIKNILQGLRTGGEMVGRGLKESDLAFVQGGWRIVEKNQQKIYDLVLDMLTYSKEREPTLADVDLNALVADVVELTAGVAAQRGIALRTELRPDLPACSADYEALHRALLNLVGNALDAVEENLDAEGIDGGPSVVVATMIEPGTGWFRVEVCDTGCGIPAEKLADVFRPFVSSKGNKGTGLGLPVSRKILREHGGDLIVTSTPGHGCTFALRLPGKVEPAPEAHPTRAIPVVPPGTE